MSDGTKISWSDATWNPITGCSVKSPGCTNCYAMKLAGTRLKHHQSRKGLTKETNGNHVWNGEVRFNEQWLDQPLRWKKPRMIFVCAHGDLFHENVPDEWIDRVFAVMALCPQHTFQVLTKRSDRMKEYCEAAVGGDNFCRQVDKLLDAGFDGSHFNARYSHLDWNCETGAEIWGWDYDLADIIDNSRLPNVWLGISAEDQQRANERIPDLLQTPAAVRFVSIEPQLEHIDLIHLHIGFSEPYGKHEENYIDGLAGFSVDATWQFEGNKIDWIICGSESGLGCRSFNENWARSLRAQCHENKTAFFYKQKIGDDGKKEETPELDGRSWTEFPEKKI